MGAGSLIGRTVLTCLAPHGRSNRGRAMALETICDVQPECCRLAQWTHMLPAASVHGLCRRLLLACVLPPLIGFIQPGAGRASCFASELWRSLAVSSRSLARITNLAGSPREPTLFRFAHLVVHPNGVISILWREAHWASGGLGGYMGCAGRKCRFDAPMWLLAKAVRRLLHTLCMSTLLHLHRHIILKA